MAAKTYIVHNSAQISGTNTVVKQTSGTALQTHIQLAPLVPIRIISFGYSMDTAVAAGYVELFANSAAATMTTAYAAGDVQPFGDPNAPANTAGTSGIPLALGTAYSGFATTTVTEGTVAAARMAYCSIMTPPLALDYTFPLGREFEVKSGEYFRFRTKFAAATNIVCYIVFEC
jgi:hypothetical protein